MSGTPVLTGKGRVTWTKAHDPKEPSRPYGMGVQFTELDTASRPVLDRLLKRAGPSRQDRRHPRPSRPRRRPVRPAPLRRRWSAVAARRRRPSRTSDRLRFHPRCRRPFPPASARAREPVRAGAGGDRPDRRRHLPAGHRAGPHAGPRGQRRRGAGASGRRAAADAGPGPRRVAPLSGEPRRRRSRPLAAGVGPALAGAESAQQAKRNGQQLLGARVAPGAQQERVGDEAEPDGEREPQPGERAVRRPSAPAQSQRPARQQNQATRAMPRFDKTSAASRRSWPARWRPGSWPLSPAEDLTRRKKPSRKIA